MPPAPDALQSRLAAVVAARYDVERPLGSGGMGAVFLARDVTLDRPVALKVLAPEVVWSAEARRRFLLEARTVARLRHPHIVSVYAAGEADDLLWFAMEFVPGESLRERLDREGPIAPEDVAVILHDLALALDAAHAAGIIHRDVKPENILLDRETGRAMLSDFGLARALVDGDGRTTLAGIVLGSPQYMSPEQAAGADDLDGRSDLYSLGLVGWELLTGRPAVEASTPQAMLAQHLTTEVPPVRDHAAAVPPALADAIMRALRKRPEERFARGRAFANVLAGRPESEAEVSGARRAMTAPARPTRTTRRALAVAGLVATTALGAWFVQQRDANAPASAESREWLVAPFELQTGNTALDWLREGAVNMLGLSLSHWDDLSVVDYERTLDLLRAERADRDDTRRLALEEARQLARRAGAGSLIMGQITTANDSLVVVARRYDVATGARIDEATAGAPLAADPRLVFDAIARELLDLAGGPALTVALRQQTTASVESYRHYLAGLQALNRWQLPRADSLFAIATALDSTFALAHYKRSVGLGWRNIADSTYAESAERAVQYGDRLPTRLREVVAGNRDLARGFTALRRNDREAARAAWASAQQRLATLLATDSTNVDAWYILADADFHAALGTGMRSADSIALLLTRSMRGFERAVALDSSFHLAYEHLVNLHRFGAQEQSGIVIVDGAVRPRRAFTDTTELPELRRRSQERTKQLAAHWVTLEPDGAQAWSALLDTYGVLKQHDSALVHLAQASRRPAVYSPGMAYMQASYRLRAQRPDGVHDALRDAMRRFPPDTLRARRGTGAVQLPLVGAAVAASTGAFALADSLLRHAAITTPTLTSVQMPTRELAPFLSAGLRLGAGVRPTSELLSAVRTGIARLERESVTAGTRATYAGVPYAAYLASRDSAFAVVARRWLADDGVRARELDAMLALDRGDTMRARAIADSFTTPERLSRATLSYAGLRVLTQADVRARLGDARGALAAYTAISPANFQFTISEPGAPAWTRSHLERARLYEQLGVRDSARLAYDTFASWWNDADPALQGAVRAARSAAQRLQDAPGTRAIPTARR